VRCTDLPAADLPPSYLASSDGCGCEMQPTSPRPSPAFPRLALHHRWKNRFKSAKPTECASHEQIKEALHFCAEWPVLHSARTTALQAVACRSPCTSLSSFQRRPVLAVARASVRARALLAPVLWQRPMPHSLLALTGSSGARAASGPCRSPCTSSSGARVGSAS
jgi:hypothetical protein